MQLYDEFFKLIKALKHIEINYALIGGIAMAFHAHPRFTRDIDLLVMENEFEKTKNILNELGYFESAKPWTFKKANLTLHRFMKIEGENYLVVDILIGNEEKHKDIITNSLIEPYDGGHVHIARKEDIIWMKQCRDSEQDRVDIRKLQDDEN